MAASPAKPSIFIIGHSLGAVMAQYAAAAARKEGVSIAGVYAFASPNVGGNGGILGHSWIKRYT